MNELPKIVQARLRGNDASPHPDADVLTAFYEQALPENERQPVLSHLAQCADCRDALALALPPISEAASPVDAMSEPAAATRSWSGWGVSGWMRWASVAACIVVVVAAVRLAHPPADAIRPKSDLDAVQLQSEAHAPAGTVPADKAGTVPPDNPTSAQAEKSMNPPVAPATVNDAPPSPAPRKTNNADSGKPNLPARAMTAGSAVYSRQSAPNGTMVRNERSQLTAAQPYNGAAQAAPAAAAGGTIPSNAVVALKPAPPRAQPAQTTAESQPSPKIAPESRQAETIGRAKAGAVTAEAASSQEQVETMPAQPILAKSFGKEDQNNPTADSAGQGNAIAQWTLSPDGQLQRSFDQGKTWSAVPVVNRMKFTAWSSVGADIWVGGAAGVLYHSADNGRTWTLMKPAAGETVLTADISKVTFIDPQHGTVITSDGQTWTTSDGGRNWQIKP